jgi:hypothetical protein
MNFQQLKNDNQMIASAVIDYCIRSKPYDFCSIKSQSLKMIQIKKYYEFLLTECDIFYCSHNNKVTFFVALSQREAHIEIQFIFSGPFDLVKNFRAFREFYWNKFDHNKPFVGEVRRHYKLKTYLNYIKKRDKNVKFSLDNGKILVSYSRDGL